MIDRNLHQAEAVSASLPALLVAADRVAATVAQGVHGRRRVGPGETFWQFRRYQPGDSTHRIDWRTSARSQRVYVRQTEWEAAQSVWLWRDGSASMDYRSRPERTSKRARAELLLLATAALLARGGERMALLGEGRTPATGRATVRRLAEALLGERAPAGVPPAEALPRYARIVLFADFLAPLDELQAIIAHYAGRGLRGHLVQVLDPAEETLPFAGRVRFEGPEDEGEILIGRVEDVREDYCKLLAAHREALIDLCRSAGWTFAVDHTDRAPEPALLTLYLALSDFV